MKNINKFIMVGVMTVSSLYLADKVASNVDIKEAQELINKLEKKEHIPLTIVNDNIYASYLRQSKSENYELNLGLITTNMLKIFAPLKAMQASTKGSYIMTLYHEYCHADLTEKTKQENQLIFNASENQKINEKISYFLKHRSNSLLMNNFHESYADAKSAILMIQQSPDNLSQEEIKAVIESKYHQVKNQKDILWGSFGDFEHRTDVVLKTVLNTSFEKIKNLSSKESDDLSLSLASKAIMHNFPDVVYAQVINQPYFQNGLSEQEIKTFASNVKGQQIALKILPKENLIDKIKQARALHLEKPSNIQNKI